MTRTITDKLMATVIEFVELGERFPASVLKDQIGMDIRVEQGSVSTKKKVRLAGPDSEETLEIVGIEMLSNRNDPNLVRVFCPRPKKWTLSGGKAEGWTLSEV
jgi:hypothetical protein